ncbi:MULTISPECIES: ABC transporter ATP-binding protein [unclassified Halomonas]
MRTAGDRAQSLRSSIFKLGLSAVLQGLALASILPLIDALCITHDMNSALVWLSIFTLCFAFSAALRWRAYHFEFRGEMIMITQFLRTELGRKMRQMPLQDIQGARSGELIHTLLTSVDSTLSYVLGVANAIFTSLLVPIIVAIVLLAYDWRLSLALLAVFPAIVFFYHRRRPAFGQSARGVDEAHKALYSDAVEYIQGLAILKAVGQESAQRHRLQARFDDLEAMQRKDTQLGSSPNLLMTSMVELGMLTVMLLGVYLVMIGQLPLALLGAFLVIVIRFAEPLSSLVLYTYMFDMLESAMGDLDTLRAQPNQVVFEPQQQPRDYGIEFSQMSFQYANSNKVGLCDVSLSIPERSMTAIVGPSGAGKTTLMKLMQRYADPQCGAIRIGGADIRHMSAAELSGLVSVVFQDVYLFNDTVLHNIHIARPSATREEVQQAARLANCDEFVQALPQGYETIVGERGGNLSGGERQRISIARAILKDSPILVLDEPTASLDVENETLVQGALNYLVKSRTVIVISHRLSTVQGADRIVVLEAGRVTECGNHNALMARQGTYYRMQMAQCSTA